MNQSDWLQIAALLMSIILILPAILRLPWKSTRILTFIAAWLAIFAVVAFAYRLFGGS